jgi:hypothetical protein
MHLRVHPTYRRAVIEIARRTNRLPPPLHIVWSSLTDPHAPGSRPWLRLRADEVEPTVIEAEPPGWVVWSSLWPARPGDRVDLRLSEAGSFDTRLSVVLLTPDEPPDDEEARRLRRRLSEFLFADLRFSYGQ